MRLDRFAAVTIAPLIRNFRVNSDLLSVPILMYHSISNLEDPLPHPYYETRTSPRTFEEQMKFLHANGYSSFDLGNLSGNFENDGKGRKGVVITFDDGYKNFLLNAFPIMDKYGFTATVFLATAMMGSRSSMFGGMEILDWSEVRELRKRGVKFGSHTVNHRTLKKLALEEVDAEIRESKKEIESHLGEPVEAFSYPYAFPEERADFLGEYFRILDQYGYRIAVTTVIGRVAKGDNPLALKRLPVNENDDLALFKAKLDGDYDWVHVPQYLRKKCFGWIGE